MVIADRIYGTHEINSPVLLELIHSKPMQRLKGIGQLGQPEETDPRKYKFSRFQHCVGVMLLLRILGASEEEQIAGLLHDVSHTAFSHTIDSVLRRGNSQDFQDQQHERFIVNSEIPEILKKHNYSVIRIYNYKFFSLLEQPLPRLCADRVDYSLRESPKIISKRCLPVLVNFNGVIAFKDVKIAKFFAERFLHLQQTSWGGEMPVIREQVFTALLQYALENNYIIFEDFWRDDEFLLSKLKKIKDPQIIKLFNILRHTSFNFSESDFTVKHVKFRFVDPDIVINGKLVPLTSLDFSYKDVLNIAQSKNGKGIKVPIIPKA